MMKPTSLSFPDASWESSYRSRHETLSLRPRQLFLVLGSLLMLALIPLDPHFEGSSAPTIWLIRGLVVATLLTIHALISGKIQSGLDSHALASCAVSVVLAANLLMMWLTGPDGYHHFQTTHLLVLMIGFWGLRVRWAPSLTPLLAASVVDAVVLIDFERNIEELGADLVFSLATLTAVGFTSYSWERHERRAFLDRLIIDDEQRLLQDLNHVLHETAVSDPLTGLLNRRSLDARLSEVVSQAKRYGTESSLVLIDLDRFKVVNDTRGHAAGDTLLCRVAEALKSGIRETDLAFRVGGDEFCLLLPHTPAEQAAELTRRILSDLRNKVTDGTDIVSFSAGCAGTNLESETTTTLMHRADELLYQAKAIGRGLVCVDSAQVA